MYIIGSYLQARLARKMQIVYASCLISASKALDAKGSKEITAVEIVMWSKRCKSGYNLGGEQSGHVVIMDYNTIQVMVN